MPDDIAPPPHRPVAWQDVDELIGELEDLSRAETAPHEFYARLLERAVAALGGVAGAVWLGSGERLDLECQLNRDAAGVTGTATKQQQHARLAAALLRGGGPRAVPPRSGLDGDDGLFNAADLLLLAAPWTSDGRAVGLIEVYRREAASPAAERGMLRFLATLGDVVGEFLRQRELRELRNLREAWIEYDRYSASVHGSLELEKTIYAIVNEGARLIGCDRLSLLRVQGRRCRLAAISGLDVVDRRATVVRRLEELAQAVLLVDEPLWYVEETAGLAPEIEEPLAQYLDAAASRRLAAVALKQGDQTCAVLVADHFEGELPLPLLRQRFEEVRRRAEPALVNALVHDDVPLKPLVRCLQGLRWLTRARQLPKTSAVLSIALIVLAALILIPAELTVTGTGELQPVRRFDVFAPGNGVVAEILVGHGDPVTEGQPLIVLSDSELNLEFARVLAELQTTQARLAVVNAARLERSTSAKSRPRDQQLAAEEQELKALLASLQQQREILEQQDERLTVRSPVDGQVLTWDVERQLRTRPVQRGQALLTVADVSGPWDLEIRVSDRDVGHLLAAQGEDPPPLSFSLQTNPGVVYRGKVVRVAEATQLDEDGAATVLVTGTFAREAVEQLRPGATVVPRIECGRRPLGYVWLHDLWDAVRTKWLLWF